MFDTIELQKYLFELSQMTNNDFTELVTGKTTAFSETAELRIGLKNLEVFRLNQSYVGLSVTINIDTKNYWCGKSGKIAKIFPRTDVKDYNEFRVDFDGKFCTFREDELVINN